MVNLTMLVRNRPRLTRQALNSLIPTKNCNITVLDDRSDEDTVHVLKSYPGMIYALRNEWAIGTGELRNKVINASAAYFGRGEYLYLSDNDVRFTMHWWLELLVSCYERAEKLGFKVLGAYNHPYHIPVARHSLGHDAPWVDEVQALALQSMLMRWEVWDQYGPFTSTPVDKVCQSEDVNFTNKIKADGFKIGVVSPALVVSTGITNTFGDKIPGWEVVHKQAPVGVIIE